MAFRSERDSMGELLVPADSLWGAQTQRSLQYFAIGEERMPDPLIKALAEVKRAAARANHALGRLGERRCALISSVCDEILDGLWDAQFPLSVWQTGSGTQTNMNLNEVIATRGNQLAGERLLHPNDHVNLSQSSNDSFPTAMHIAAALSIHRALLPALDGLSAALLQLEHAHPSLIKIGRTHLQDAVPIRFSQEVSGWRALVTESRRMLLSALPPLYELALGGTAVGTGLNAPAGFSEAAIADIAARTALPFRPAANKFHALSSKDAMAFCHSALKVTAGNLMKLANDLRLLASGPRCGLSELTLPANEPGSSIMPGKVNPTQCEAMTMVCVQVMGNDAAVGFAASQGQLQLNVFMPLIAHNTLQSIRLLSDACTSFTRHCVQGIEVNEGKMAENLSRSLMTVTALTPHLGYDQSARIAKLAFEEDISLREAAQQLDLMRGEEFDRLFRPEDMA